MANSVIVKDVKLNVGDTVVVHYSFGDKDKRKSQLFEGILLAVKGRENNKMFTVRKMTKSGIAVERIFPVISPFIEKIEVALAGNARRANVGFIRTKSRREIKETLYHRS